MPGGRGRGGAEPAGALPCPGHGESGEVEGRVRLRPCANDPTAAMAMAAERMLLDHAPTVKVLQAAVTGLSARKLDRLKVTVAAVDNQTELCVAGYPVPLDDTHAGRPSGPRRGPRRAGTVRWEDCTNLDTRVAVAADKNGSPPLPTGIRTRLTTRLVEDGRNGVVQGRVRTVAAVRRPGRDPVDPRSARGDAAPACLRDLGESPCTQVPPDAPAV